MLSLGIIRNNMTLKSFSKRLIYLYIFMKYLISLIYAALTFFFLNVLHIYFK